MRKAPGLQLKRNRQEAFLTEKMVPDNGKEQIADAAKICYWSDGEKANKDRFKELSEEDKAKFEKLPLLMSGTHSLYLETAWKWCDSNYSHLLRRASTILTQKTVNLVVTVQKITENGRNLYAGGNCFYQASTFILHQLP